MSELGPSPLSTGDDQLSVEAARTAIAAALQPITETETLPLTAALGRILGVDIVSPISVPAHDNSAMDGYALRGSDLRADADTVLTVTGTVHAGDVPDFETAAGQCVRIMTGAVMPKGLDTVVPQELCRAADGVVHIAPGTVRPGDNRRLQGARPARRPPRAHRRPAAAPGRPRSDRLARHRRRSPCGAGCAWRCSPPATSCARWASRWTPAASTTATATA